MTNEEIEKLIDDLAPLKEGYWRPHHHAVMRRVITGALEAGTKPHIIEALLGTGIRVGCETYGG